MVLGNLRSEKIHVCDWPAHKSLRHSSNHLCDFHLSSYALRSNLRYMTDLSTGHVFCLGWANANDPDQDRIHPF